MREILLGAGRAHDAGQDDVKMPELDASDDNGRGAATRCALKQIKRRLQ